MSLDRTCGEYIVWRRVRDFSGLDGVRDALCGLLFDSAAETVVSVLLFVDEVCAPALEQDTYPIDVCLVRGTEPHYLRLDLAGAGLVAPTRPGFMDNASPEDSAGWGVIYHEQGVRVWGYLTLPMPAGARQAAPWSRLAVHLPANPTLN